MRVELRNHAARVRGVLCEDVIEEVGEARVGSLGRVAGDPVLATKIEGPKVIGTKDVIGVPMGENDRINPRDAMGQ